MQIVRELGGYTMGRSDNVRRAMSKKKISVMEKERDIFINGNAVEIAEANEKGENPPVAVPGCVQNGIDPKVASGIYDTMIDFAKYAFNKSHAACYAVVAYQTAYLKHYYPAEYMAALLTSVMGNFSKMSGYIISCNNMGLSVLPPDINEGEADFAVTEGGIRYALTAIKGVGRNVIDVIIRNRIQEGVFKSLQDFARRCADEGVNKRAVENFIKAGAFDSFGFTRKQLMSVYNDIFDSVHARQKNGISGQLSLFDMVDEEEKESLEIQIPEKIGEFDKESLLAFEKDVLGIYVSGHPLESYSKLWDKIITAKTFDFYLDEDTGETIVKDGAKETIGGMVVSKKMKYTKRNEAMAFITVEDLFGIVEVIVFPKVYKTASALLDEDKKVLITGRVSLEDNMDGKLIAESVTSMDMIPKNFWLQFEDEAQYKEKYGQIEEILKLSDGKDNVVIYIRDTKKVIRLPRNMSVNADSFLTEQIGKIISEDNIRITY